ncbi:MAG: thioesterase family protein [Bacteroidaceae bacterium]|nr:thioesterase family protein [Bacteroidaceae bacterium]
MLKEGLKYTSHIVVEKGNCASMVGSGGMDVFATPSMVALMENAAMNAVAAVLPEGATTVGTEINVAHTKASGIGAEISATALLVAVDGRKLLFEVEASDGEGLIGKGTHTRFIVDCERFLSKVYPGK